MFLEIGTHNSTFSICLRDENNPQLFLARSFELSFTCTFTNVHRNSLIALIKSQLFTLSWISFFYFEWNACCCTFQCWCWAREVCSGRFWRWWSWASRRSCPANTRSSSDSSEGQSSWTEKQTKKIILTIVLSLSISTHYLIGYKWSN